MAETTTSPPAAAGSLSELGRRRPAWVNPRLLLPLVILAVAAVAYGAYRLHTSRLPYEWSGTVEARTISVGSRAGGRVKDVLVREGDRVTAGQALVVLEPGDLEAQRLAARGQFEQAQATVDKLVKGARPEEIQEARARAATAAAALRESVAGSRSEEIAAGRARLIAAQAAADKAQQDADRATKLFGTSAISQAELESAQSALKAAVAQRDAQQQVVEELQNGVRREEIAQAQARASEAAASAKLVEAGSRVEDIRAAQGALDAAKGRLDQIEITLDELQIRAPRPARVEALDLRPGDILAPNATAATLLEEGQLYVRIFIPETVIGRVRVGQEVPITVDSFPGRTFKGVIEHINGVGEYSPRNLQTADERADQVFAARVGLREGENDLRAGMAAFVTVPK